MDSHLSANCQYGFVIPAIALSVMPRLKIKNIKHDLVLCNFQKKDRVKILAFRRRYFCYRESDIPILSIDYTAPVSFFKSSSSAAFPEITSI